MKQMTTKDLTLLGKDLKMARILVMKKHGFETDEIATVMGLSESHVRKLISAYEEHSK